MSDICILERKCTRCGLCKDVCPNNAIVIEGDSINIENEKCTLCGLCNKACTNKAIIYQGIIPSNTEVLKHNSCICIYIEHYDGKIYPSVLEVICVARKLKQQKSSNILAIIVGSDVRKLVNDTISFGVDEVWVVDKPNIHSHTEDIHTKIISELISEIKPSVFLASGTRHGRSLFPRIAARLKTGLCADCIELYFDELSSNLIVARTAYSGKIMAKISIPEHRPQMATVKQGIFEAAPKIDGYKGKIVDRSTSYVIQESVFEIVKVTNKKYDLANLNQAQIIVAVGRGIKKAENLPLIYSFAKALGGSVGASRAIVDCGWIHHSHQIGQTGKIVKPRIYFACGISGAIQHLVGIQKSEMIVTINSDKGAPIVDVSEYAIIGDLFDIIPEFIKQLTQFKY